MQGRRTSGHRIRRGSTRKSFEATCSFQRPFDPDQSITFRGRIIWNVDKVLADGQSISGISCTDFDFRGPNSRKRQPCSREFSYETRTHHLGCWGVRGFLGPERRLRRLDGQRSGALSNAWKAKPSSHRQRSCQRSQDKVRRGDALPFGDESAKASRTQIPEVEVRRVNGLDEMRPCGMKRRALVAVSNSVSVLDWPDRRAVDRPSKSSVLRYETKHRSLADLPLAESG